MKSLFKSVWEAMLAVVKNAGRDSAILFSCFAAFEIATAPVILGFTIINIAFLPVWIAIFAVLFIAYSIINFVSKPEKVDTNKFCIYINDEERLRVFDDILAVSAFIDKKRFKPVKRVRIWLGVSDSVYSAYNSFMHENGWVADVAGEYRVRDI
jgi:hypothetical protein